MNIFLTLGDNRKFRHAQSFFSFASKLIRRKCQNNPRQSTKPPTNKVNKNILHFVSRRSLLIQSTTYFCLLEDRRLLNYIMESDIEAVCLFLALVLLQVGHDPSRDCQPSASHDDAGDKLLLKQKWNYCLMNFSEQVQLKAFRSSGRREGKLCNIFFELAPHSAVLS